MNGSLFKFLLVCISLLVMGLIVAGSSNAAIDPKSAFVVWLFDEGTGTAVKDYSGNGNDGKFVKDVKWVDGKINKGVKFNGADTGIMSSTAKGVGKTAFTEVLWIKFDDLAPESLFGYISCTGTSNGRYLYFSSWNSAGAPHDAIHMGTLDKAGNWGRGIATAGKLFTKGQWYFIAGVVDTKNGFIKVYSNGKMVQELKIDAGDTPGTPKEIWVGASPENYQWVNGTIDEVAFYNVALGDVDINNIMNKGLMSTTSVEPSDKLPVTWSQIKAQ